MGGRRPAAPPASPRRAVAARAALARRHCARAEHRPQARHLRPQARRQCPQARRPRSLEPLLGWAVRTQPLWAAARAAARAAAQESTPPPRSPEPQPIAREAPARGGGRRRRRRRRWTRWSRQVSPSRRQVRLRRHPVRPPPSQRGGGEVARVRGAKASGGLCGRSRRAATLRRGPPRTCSGSSAASMALSLRLWERGAGRQQTRTPVSGRRSVASPPPRQSRSRDIGSFT